MKTKILILLTVIFSQIVLAQKENVKSDVSTKELKIVTDSTKTKKNKYFTVDILGTAINCRFSNEENRYVYPRTITDELQNEYPPDFIARQIRIMKSSGRFKYGLDFYLEKEYNDTYYTEFVNHKKLTFKNTNTNYYINPIFAFYPIQRKKYALGIHLETMIHLNSIYYAFNKNISLHTDYHVFNTIPSYIISAVLPSEIEVVNEIKLTQNISLLNSVGFKQVSSHYFESSYLYDTDYVKASMENSLFLNIGLRLNTQFFNQNKLIVNHYQNHGIIVNTGVSYGGVFLSRHFKDPEIVQPKIQYMISKLGLQSSFPLIEISLLSKNLINHTLGYNYSALSVSTVADAYYSDAEYKYKTNNIYYQFDKGLFKKKFNDKFFYPYIGCKIGLAYETFNSIFYYHYTDTYRSFVYRFYSKQAYILTGQSVAGVRTNFNRVNIDMGIGYTLYSKLWGKYNFLYGEEGNPTYIETTQSGDINTSAKFYFNDFYVKIGYKF